MNILLIEGPEDTLGVLSYVIVPIEVTIVVLMSISSILPYLFFFIPEAFVAIQPPKVENS